MVISHLLSYWLEHPAAKDTLRGIRRWWLPGHVSAWDEDAVQAALDTLVARGWVVQRRLTLSQTLYALNQDQIEAIRTFLDELENWEEAPAE
jgi:hypothetical protein